MARDAAPAGAPRIGTKVLHKYNRDLGPGRVEEIGARRLVVFFPRTGERLTFGAGDIGLKPLELSAGRDARIEESGEIVTLECDGMPCRARAAPVGVLGKRHPSVRHLDDVESSGLVPRAQVGAAHHPRHSLKSSGPAAS